MVRILTTVVLLSAAFTTGLWSGILYTDARSVAETTGEASPPPLPPTPAPTNTPSSTATPIGPYTGEVVAFGDYLFLSVAPCLEAKTFTVDAVADRRARQAIGELALISDDLPGAVLLHLGANGGATEAELDQIMAVLGPERLVVWSTIQLPDDETRYTFEDSTNAAIIAMAQKYPNVRILSWNSLSMTNPDWLNRDGSMTEAGCVAYADFAEGVIRGT